MSRPIRNRTIHATRDRTPAALAVALAAVIGVSACAGTSAGTAVSRPGATTSVATTSVAIPTGPTTDTSTAIRPPCSDVTYADPYIAFEDPLQDGAELAVGDHGWIDVTDLDDVRVSGDKDAVVLQEKTSPIEIRCGEVTGSVSWIEVTGAEVGNAVMEFGGRTIAVKVVPSH